MVSILNALKENRYPGRGILMGKSTWKNGRDRVFSHGRSENSQNRIFREDGDTLLILPFDESKILRSQADLYTPIRICNGAIVVTNGGPHGDRLRKSIGVDTRFNMP
ncbi:MAG: IMP cyclohydrolase [Eubacteriales bacterium]